MLKTARPPKKSAENLASVANVDDTFHFWVFTEAEFTVLTSSIQTPSMAPQLRGWGGARKKERK